MLPFPKDARLRRDGSTAEPDRILERNGVRCAGFDLGSGAYGFEVSTG